MTGADVTGADVIGVDIDAIFAAAIGTVAVIGMVFGGTHFIGIIVVPIKSYELNVLIICIGAR